MSQSLVKTRFCPSPTGNMHLGNVRTALFNVLLAQHHNGICLLRIEDTDVARSRDQFRDSLCYDLRWLGLDWQEGYEAGGTFGPYLQSQRSDIYESYYQKLLDQGHAYPCFCDDAALKLERKTQLAQGKPPRYSGRCRHLTAEDIAKRIEAGEKPSLRFRIPDEGEVVCPDLVKGTQSFQCADLGDFIIRRSDGSSAFMFCNAVDDALMEVNHALRGEDHLTNTPRQNLILTALGLKSPEYGHINLIVGHDGAPLSKRHGSQSIASLRDQGFLSIAIVNYLARLGHYYQEDRLMTLSELAQGFSLHSLGQSPSKFDQHQLLSWQKRAVQAMSPEAFHDWALPYMEASVSEAVLQQFMAICHANVVFPDDVTQWSHAMFASELAWSETALEIINEAGLDFFKHCEHAFLGSQDYTAALSTLKEASGKKGKALFMPLRVALTGKTSGPELIDITTLMGSDLIRARFLQVQQHLSM